MLYVQTCVHDIMLIRALKYLSAHERELKRPEGDLKSSKEREKAQKKRKGAQKRALRASGALPSCDGGQLSPS